MTTPFLTNLRALSVRFICSVISEGMEGGGEGEERKEGEREGREKGEVTFKSSICCCMLLRVFWFC